MRGTALSAKKHCSHCRITPAHAGNSSNFGMPPIPGRDHPRSCGEQWSLITAKLEYMGSPPLMRGTGNNTSSIGGAVGITPAHAGNSINGVSVVILAGDHPRSCGEQSDAL